MSVYPGVEADNRWYQRAVFYEVLVRGYSDASADGNGDLRGLAERLDYLQWLGVDCIWLLPFYDSPLRDGGYDISDFFTVLPEYGDLGDAVSLVEETTVTPLAVIPTPAFTEAPFAKPLPSIVTATAEPDCP